MTTAPAVPTSPSERQSPANEVVSYSYEFMIQVEECFSNEFEKQDCYDAFDLRKQGRSLDPLI